MTRLKILVLILGAVTQPAAAQDEPPRQNVEGMPERIRPLLDSARIYIERGQRGRAEVFALEIVWLRDYATIDQHIQALQILSMARYPAEVQLAPTELTQESLIGRPPSTGSGRSGLIDRLIEEGTNLLETAVREEVYDTVRAKADSILNQIDDEILYRPEALELKTAAIFPDFDRDSTGSLRWLSTPDGLARVEAASVFLREIIRIDPIWRLSPSVRFPELDALMYRADSVTYGVSAKRLFNRVPIGAARQALFAVEANRPSSFTLTATRCTSPTRCGAQLTDNGAVRRDTVDAIQSATQGILYLDLLSRDSPLRQPTLSPGTYLFEVIAINDSTGETLATEFTGNLTAPRLLLDDSIPTAFETTPQSTLQLVPFTQGPKRILNERAPVFETAIIGLGLGVGTALIATVFRHGDLKAAVERDNRALVIGGAVSLSSIVAAFSGPGRRLRGRVDHNRALQDAFDGWVATRWAHNDSIINNYDQTARIEIGRARRPRGGRPRP